MRLLKFFETVTLFEAAIDRYLQPFERIIQLANELDPAKGEAMAQWANTEASWAISTLRKDDKIQWYLRFAKAYLLHKLYVHAEMVAGERDPSKAPVAQQVERAYQKFASTMSKKMGIAVTDVPVYGEQVSYKSDFKRRMEHFMSLDLDGIENTILSWQKPQEVWAAWTPIERDWQEKASKLVDIDHDDTETIIKFPDGSEWINLNKPYCDLEARAMGHCGNAASYTENDTVLSYRTIEKTPKGEMWKPRLTFILDTTNGLLGEMKGRANQKPSPKYHGVIMDLLRHDIVKGIKGGGYEPKKNFSMEDLPEDVHDKLIDEKPGLASIKHDYKKRGMTNELMTRIVSKWDDTGVRDELTYDAKSKTFVISTVDNLKDIVSEVAGDQGKYVMDVLDGTEYIEGYTDGAPIEDLWNDLPNRVIDSVGNWLFENYTDAIEEWKEEYDTEFTTNDADEVWQVMDEFADDAFQEIRMALDRGWETGQRYGMEKEMFEAVESWVESLPNGEGFNISLVPGFKDSDAKQEIHIGEEDVIEIVTDFADALEYQGEFMAFMKSDGGLEEIEQPYYGWGHGEFDNEAAIEDASEQIAEIVG